MALDRDELNKRRQAREEARKKQRQRQLQLYRRLALAAIVLLACGVGIYFLSRGGGETSQETVPAAVTQAAVYQDGAAAEDAPHRAIALRHDGSDMVGRGLVRRDDEPAIGCVARRRYRHRYAARAGQRGEARHDRQHQIDG